MKKLFFTIALASTFLTANAQNVYWSCYAMKVEDPEGFVKAFDAFMATESGKSLPGVGLSQIQFNNTINDATHQLCFFSPNPDDLQVLSKFNNVEAALLQMFAKENVEMEQSILGNSLVFDVSKVDLTFTVSYAIDVEDPIAYGKAFMEFHKAVSKMFDGDIQLHEAIAGQNSGDTHYMNASAKSMGDWFKGKEKIFSSKAFQTFATKVRPISNITNSVGWTQVKLWNAN